MRQLLVYNGFVSGGARAYSLGANSYSQIGDIIGSVDTGSTHIGSMRGGSICQVQDTIYVLHNRTIKKKLSDGSWTTVASLVSPYTTTDQAQRMDVCVVNGVTYIVVFYASSSSSGSAFHGRAAIYNTQTGVFTTTAEQFFFSGAGGFDPSQTCLSPMYFYNGLMNLIVSFSTSNGHQLIISINPEAGSFSKTGFASNIVGDPIRASLHIFNNELWMLATNGTGASAAFKLYKIISGTPVEQYTVATLTVSGVTYGWAPLLFSDGTYMYAICQSDVSSTSTWRMYRCTSTAATDITSSVLRDFAGFSRDSRWRVVVDQHSSPQNPEIILIFQPSTDSGSTNHFYKFINDSTSLQYLGSAGEGGNRCIYSHTTIRWRRKNV